MTDEPLNSLNALAAVWAEGGIRPASRKLGVAPSAVHRHLKLLETGLGIAISSGAGHRFSLTAEGENIARAAARSFDRLDRAISSARQQTNANRVIVSSTEAFASEWLVPRIGRFMADNPTTDIWLRPDRRFARMPVEASFAIRSAARDVAGHDAVPWMDERLVPVMSPSLHAQMTDDSVAGCLSDLPLLHDYDAQTSWRIYCDAHGLSRQKFERGSRFGSDSLVMDAAEEGLGVALARERLARRRVESGRLVALDRHAVDIGTGYWLVLGPEMRPAARALFDWLRDAG